MISPSSLNQMVTRRVQSHVDFNAECNEVNRLGQVRDDLRSLDSARGKRTAPVTAKYWVGPVRPTSVMVRYAVPVNPTSSLMIPANPMGSGFGSAMSTNSILLHHTFLKKSSTTCVVSCSPGQRRYPKPKGAKPA